MAQWVEPPKGDWRVVRSIPARGLVFFRAFPRVLQYILQPRRIGWLVGSLKLLAKSKNIDK